MWLYQNTMAKRTKVNKNQDETTALLEAIVAGIREKKGKEIRQLNLTKLQNASTDYFIVCHGDSQRQAVAIADSVEDEVRKLTGEKPWHVEGVQNAQWVLIDYVNVVVHVFFSEAREFYDIESLWADGEITEINEIEEILPKPAIKKTAKSSTKKTAPVTKAKVAKKPVKKTTTKAKKK